MSVFYLQCKKWTSNFAKQIPTNGFQFVFRLHLQNPRWDWAELSSDGVYLKIAVNQNGIQPFDWSSNHHAEAQRPARPRPAHSSIHPQRRWASGGGTKSWHLSNDRRVSRQWKKLFHAVPLKCMDAQLLRANAIDRMRKLRYGNVWEVNNIDK